MRRLLVCAVAATAALIGLVVAPPPTVAAAASCVVSDKLVNSCRPWLGAAAGNYPNFVDQLRSQIDAHEQRIGRPVDIVHSYHPPGKLPLSTDERYYTRRPNTMLFINWKPAARWTDAAGGNATINGQIDLVASRIAALGSRRVFLTL